MIYNKKIRGAISIFLVIILVPMMTLSALFVDASKVKLSKSLAASAADLTLNTALTDYDTKLKDLYGLFATAQDTDDLFGKLEDYYRTCITSAGVSDEDAETYVEQIMAQLGIVSKSNDVADIMNMQLVDFSVQKMDSANLANATVMEKEIIEFMKYRSPINTGLSFLSSLKSFTTLSKQTDLVEKKKEYYEAQESVMRELLIVWSNIASYNGTKIASDPQFLEDVLLCMNTLFKEGGEFPNYKKYEGTPDRPNTLQNYLGYQKVNEYAIKDMYGVSRDSEGYNFENHVSVVEDADDSTDYKISGNNTDTDYYKNYSKKNLPSASDITTQLDNLIRYQANGQSAYKKLTEYSPSDYSVRYVVRESKNGYETFSNNVIQEYIAYQKLQAMIKAEKDYDEDYLDVLNTAYKNKASKYKEDYWTLSSTFDDIAASYLSDMNKLAYYSDEYNSQEDDARGKADIAFNYSDINVGYIASTTNVFVKDLENAKKYLTDAILHLNSAKNILESDVAAAKGAWNTVANDKSISSTSQAKQDKAEIDQLDNYLNSENITKLVTRLTNIKNNVDGILTKVNAYKYCGTSLKDIQGTEKLLEVLTNSVGKSEMDSLPINESSLNGKVSTIWSKSWTKGGLTKDSIKWVNQSGTQADLTKDKLAMYSYLYSHFASSEVNKAETTPSTETKSEDPINGENLYKSIKNKSKEETKSNTDSSSNGGASKDISATKKITDAVADGKNIATVPSKIVTVPGGNLTEGKIETEPDNVTSASSTSLGSIFGDSFLSAIDSAATDLRDKLYIADYCLGMFSYDTIENEYKKENKGDIVSLTKNDISKANNYAYGSEVEYIIFGKDELKSNVTAAYASIYGIRFGFNLVYAFATSEIRESALAIATPISAATLGIIPVPLIQAVIIIGIACVESGIDLVDLGQGLAVPLYKTQDTWHCSISGLLNEAKGLAGTVIKEATGTLIDKGVDKLSRYLDMSAEELQKLTADEINDLSETVGAAYDQIITNNANIVIQMALIEVTSAVEELRCIEGGVSYTEQKDKLVKDIVEKLNSWKNSDAQMGSDLASKVKRSAVDVITKNDGKLIKSLFDTIEAQMVNTSGSAVEDAINGLASEGSLEGKMGEVAGAIMEDIKIIRSNIMNTINASGTEINNYISKAKNSVSGSITKGAEEFKKNLNSQIDDICGTSDGSGGDSATGLAALFSFTYSDYLRLFLLIGEYSGEERVILRVGDVIQKNMAFKNKCDQYALINSAVYVKLTAEIQTKPTLLAIPLFEDTANNPNDDTNWYTYTYSGSRGY